MSCTPIAYVPSAGQTKPRSPFRLSASTTLWESTGKDPVSFLGAVGRARLEELAADRAFLEQLGAARADSKRYLTGDRWYQRRVATGEETAPTRSPTSHPSSASPRRCRSTPAASASWPATTSRPPATSACPLIGVGLLYRHGYFRQALSRDGWQQEHYPVLDPDELPVALLREPNGTGATVCIALPGGRALRAQIWLARSAGSRC